MGRPGMVGRIISREVSPPSEGRLELQVAKGVGTTNTQFDRRELSPILCNKISNAPVLFVVVLDTTLPLQRSWTTASTTQHKTQIRIYIDLYIKIMNFISHYVCRCMCAC